MAGRGKNRIAVAPKDCPGMINLEPVAVVQLHGEHSKRLPRNKRLKETLEILGGHDLSLIHRHTGLGRFARPLTLLIIIEEK
jgi:hypothetical protein